MQDLGTGLQPVNGNAPTSNAIGPATFDRGTFCGLRRRAGMAGIDDGAGRRMGRAVFPEKSDFVLRRIGRRI